VLKSSLRPDIIASVLCQLFTVKLCILLNLWIDMRFAALRPKGGSAASLPPSEPSDRVVSVHYKNAQTCSVLGWLLLVWNSFLLRVPFPMAGAGYLTIGCVNLLGSFVFFRPLAAGQRIQPVLRQYAVLIHLVMYTLTYLTSAGRCDAYPYLHWYERLRYCSNDLIYHILLYVGFWEMRKDPFKIFPWLNTWSLLTFVVHIGFIRACSRLGIEVWSFPLLLLWTVPLSWLLHNRGGKGAEFGVSLFRTRAPKATVVAQRQTCKHARERKRRLCEHISVVGCGYP